MPIDVSKQITEAMERGEFANLPGKGKPLKLDTNPYLTPQARMVNRLLKENGFAPRWVELEKEIKKEKAQLERVFINFESPPRADWRLSSSSIRIGVKCHQSDF